MIFICRILFLKIEHRFNINWKIDWYLFKIEKRWIIWTSHQLVSCAIYVTCCRKLFWMILKDVGESHVGKFIVSNVLSRILLNKFILMMGWILLTIGYVFLVMACVTVNNVKFIKINLNKLFKLSRYRQESRIKIIIITLVITCPSIDNNLTHHFNTVPNYLIIINIKRNLEELESLKNKDLWWD